MNKTQRKNKTKQVITWPSNNGYFTIKELVTMNQHMLTLPPKCSDITIRVRLNRAITEQNSVAEIGAKNGGKGRPEKVFAMRPVKQSVLDKAKADSIQLKAETLLVAVMEITNTPAPVNPATIPITLNETNSVTV
jgi:hypothetical protein